MGTFSVGQRVLQFWCRVPRGSLGIARGAGREGCPLTCPSLASERRALATLGQAEGVLWAAQWVTQPWCFTLEDSPRKQRPLKKETLSGGATARDLHPEQPESPAEEVPDPSLHRVTHLNAGGTNHSWRTKTVADRLGIHREETKRMPEMVKAVVPHQRENHRA